MACCLLTLSLSVTHTHSNTGHSRVRGRTHGRPGGDEPGELARQVSTRRLHGGAIQRLLCLRYLGIVLSWVAAAKQSSPGLTELYPEEDIDNSERSEPHAQKG